MAKLDAKRRNAIPSSEFAMPKERKYPIEDASHARDALARARQQGVYNIVAPKVHARYPNMEIASMKRMKGK